MTCDQFGETLELYALGMLESAEARAVADHLASGCPNCHEALQRAVDLNLAMAKSVPLVDPPRRLRSRLQKAISPGSAVQRQWIPWALLAAAAVLVLVASFMLQSRFRQQTEFAEAASAEQKRLLETLKIIRAPGTREVSFSNPNQPDLKGAVYVHQQLGLAMVIDRLPDAPGGWKYESWIVPKSGAPRPVEPFQPDRSGHAISVVHGPLELAEVAAMAVSMEPQDSRPTKPTTLVFAAKI